MEFVQGRVYRAKKPSNAKGFVNDRQVIWVGMNELQFDGPAVGNGRHYPRVTKEKFAEWAGEDVTDSLPKGEWLEWGKFKSERKENSKG